MDAVCLASYRIYAVKCSRVHDHRQQGFMRAAPMENRMPLQGFP